MQPVVFFSRAKSLMRVISLASLAAIAGAAQAAMVSESVRVIDGDTLELSGQVIRLHGIDAPETAQRCGTSDCGKDATRALSAMVQATRLSCDTRDTDKYGRLIAVCSADGRDVNAAMVRQGWAVAYTAYSEDYVAEERAARQAKRGIWRNGTPQMPWDYRAARWSTPDTAAPNADCPIKGNISSSGHIYHTPWSKHYSRTRIDTSRGERWFCDEAEALAAGWRAPRS